MKFTVTFDYPVSFFSLRKKEEDVNIARETIDFLVFPVQR
jgi:hypothetical protein